MYASIRVSQYKISKFEKKTSYTYWNRTFLLLACQTQEKAITTMGDGMKKMYGIKDTALFPLK